MRRPDWYLKQIRERLSIADYAGKRVAWDRRKTRSSAGDYWAPCPFHTEKSASFHVLDREGRFKCFGCGEGGDIFRLCQKLEGLDFGEAVEKLAAEAGLPPPDTSPAQQKAMDTRSALLRLTAKADAHFRRALTGPEGAAARAYLEGRGLGRDVWDQFGIGFAPDNWTWLLDTFARENVRREDVIAAGLAKEGGRNGAIDVFRNRVMFPISDSQGRVIAFGGRLIAPDPRAPKYLNSPDSEIFHKGQTLYRLKQAREIAARSKSEDIVVSEGYLDVAAFERAGVAAVAPLGTALTEDQLQLLWKSGVTPVLCFDGDAAGLKAADRALDIALPHLAPERTVRLVVLQAGLDPDDVYRRAGPDALRTLLAGATTAVDALFQREQSRRVLDTPEARADLKARLDQAAQRIVHPETRRQYERALRDKAFEALRRAPAPPKAQSGGRRDKRGGADALPTQELKRHFQGEIAVPRPTALEDLLRFTIDHPFVLEHGAALFAQVPLADPDLDSLRHAILDVWVQSSMVDRERVTSHLWTLGLDSVAQRVFAWPSRAARKAETSRPLVEGDVGSPPESGRDPMLSDGERQVIEAEWMAFVTHHLAAPMLGDEIDAARDADFDADGEAFQASWRARWERHALERDALRRGREPEPGASLAGDGA